MGLSTVNRRMWLRRELFVLTPKQLVWVHWVLQFLDWLTTFILVSCTNPSAEGNPILRLVMESAGGLWWFTLMKLLGCWALRWALLRSVKRKPWTAVVWRAVAIIYLAVVLNNLLSLAVVFLVL